MNVIPLEVITYLYFSIPCHDYYKNGIVIWTSEVKATLAPFSFKVLKFGVVVEDLQKLGTSV